MRLRRKRDGQVVEVTEARAAELLSRNIYTVEDDDTPGPSWTVARIDDWAEAHAIDLPDGVKAEKLAAIEAYLKEEEDDGPDSSGGDAGGDAGDGDADDGPEDDGGE